PRGAPRPGGGRPRAWSSTGSTLPFDRHSLENTIGRFARANTPILYAYHRMTNLIRLNDELIVDLSTFARRRIAAVSGVARPERFVADLERLEMQIALRRDFDDHHRYTREELSE